MKILILCTGNSCRSQMAEGFLSNKLKSNNNFEVLSAGSDPAKEVNPVAIKVMAEKGIDISKNYPKNVNKFIDTDINVLITVCGSARDKCPVLNINCIKHHWGFEDPSDKKGELDEVIGYYRNIRDLIAYHFESYAQALLDYNKITLNKN